MMTAILSPRPAPSKAVPNKSAPELAKCPTCDHGRCAPGANCTACLDAHRRDAEAGRRSRRREIIDRLAHTADCRPAELVELLAEIALNAQGGDV